MTVGVLALQGCVEPHITMLHRLGVNAIRVRLPSDLEKVDRLILPGGESTTMLRLMERVELTAPLKEFGKTHPLWGICAGSILLATEVRHPEQRSLGLIPVRATRNFYGSQIESFTTPLEIDFLGSAINADFIRAPLLEPLSPEVKIHARHQEMTVLMQHRRILVSSFHVELGQDTRLHEYFLSL